MERNDDDQQQAVNQVYDHAANLLVHQKMSSYETQNALMEQGLDEENAAIVVANLEQQIHSAKKERANKDMLYGALWCIGGLIATFADFGFIFWGAILFGAIQFFKGVSNAI